MRDGIEESREAMCVDEGRLNVHEDADSEVHHLYEVT